MEPWEIGLISFIIILFVLSVDMLPQVGTAIGKGIHEFLRGYSGDDNEAGTKTDSKKQKYSPESSL
jgi:Sec-independent protein translocase protein TatA